MDPDSRNSKRNENCFEKLGARGIRGYNYNGPNPTETAFGSSDREVQEIDRGFENSKFNYILGSLSVKILLKLASSEKVSDSLTGDPCAANPCQNGGTCTAEDNLMGFTCDCKEEFPTYNCGTGQGENNFI